MIRHGAIMFCAAIFTHASAQAADQTKIGAGNARAQQIGAASPLVQSAVEYLERNARQIEDPGLRSATPDSFLNPSTCIRHRVTFSRAMYPLSRAAQREPLGCAALLPATFHCKEP